MNIKIYTFKQILLMSFVGAFWLNLSSCSNNLDHPLNSDSKDYVGDIIGADYDGNGIADLLELYPNCNSDFKCALDLAIKDGLVIPKSSSSENASSSSTPPNIDEVEPPTGEWPEELEFNALYRDFPANHNSFQAYNLGDLCGDSVATVPSGITADWAQSTQIQTGMVQDDMSSIDEKNPLKSFPIKKASICENGYFAQWFTDEDPNYSKRTKLNLTKDLSASTENTYMFSSGSIVDGKGFFPLDGFGYGNQNYVTRCNSDMTTQVCKDQYAGTPDSTLGVETRNYNFTATLHSFFVYNNPEAFFEIAGDDDLWVFVDGKLVIDLGGVHNPATASFITKDISQNWPDDSIHEIHIFKAERQPTESYLKIKTNLRLFTE